MLSPSEVALVCPGVPLAITCSTDRIVLYWSVTIPPSASESGQAVTRGQLRFSSSAQIVTVEPLMVDTKVFNISTTSTIDQITSVLSVTNVTADLNGTIVLCADIDNSSMIVVRVIGTDIGTFS